MRSPAKIYSSELEGISAKLIEVEVDLGVGLHAFNIVGLADKALSEAKERVNSALKNSGIKPPNRENRRITINLAPADFRKTGSQYDLAIALGYMKATGQIGDFEASDKIFLGELALDGRLRSIGGSLNVSQMAEEKGFKKVFLPAQNANEASVIEGVEIIPVSDLLEVVDILEGKKEARRAFFNPINKEDFSVPDFGEIKGQENAKRAIMIAAAGGHNMLMIGPPGVGKSMLAKALVGILPELTTEEAIEVTKIYSAAGLDLGGLISTRPFRSPHQTSSIIALTGGGSTPKPGEISLAHRGVLFLDEVPEFQKNILESLRQPIESGVIHVARAKSTLKFPAKFSLVAAMNPCPCGFYGDPEKECRCSPYEVIRYQKKISGPLLDRIDLQVRVPRVKISQLKQKATTESKEVKEKIEEARAIQADRFKNLKIKTNSEMGAKQTEEFARINNKGEGFLEALDRARLSPRGYYRLIKVGRTIADLEKSEEVTENHLAEAFSYRLREEV